MIIPVAVYWKILSFYVMIMMLGDARGKWHLVCEYIRLEGPNENTPHSYFLTFFIILSVIESLQNVLKLSRLFLAG